MSMSEPQTAGQPEPLAPMAALEAQSPADAGSATPSVEQQPAAKKKTKAPRRVQQEIEEIPEEDRWFPEEAPRETTPLRRTEQNWTLLLCAALTLVTAVAWFSGKRWLNDHTPEGQQFTPAELPILSNRAKDAAIEFHHSLCVLDFERAALLAAPSATALVDARRSACDAKCEATRRHRARQAQTRASVLASQGREATAHAECVLDGVVDAADYKVQLEGQTWQVVGLATH